MQDYVTRVVFRYVLLLILMYGFYIVMHGHVSPGGGFAGGMVLGLGVLLYFLIYGLQWRDRLRYLPLDIAILLIGLGSIIEGLKFLLPKKGGVVGAPGELFSVGIISVVNMGIGLLVASTILAIFYLMVEDR